jgi:hypothetical protein
LLHFRVLRLIADDQAPAGNKIGAPDTLRCAKDLGLKARAYRTDWSRLAKTPLRHRSPA